MKKSLITMALALSALALAGCSSTPRSSSIENGKVTNLTSAEATTLAAKDVRQKKVSAVMEKTKPIVKLVGHAGKPITIDAVSFEVYVPLDLAVLMQEEAPFVSEEVQKIDAYGKAIQRATPAILGGLALADRNGQRNTTEKLAETQAGVDKEQIAADAAEAAAQREALAAANAATIAALKEAEAARLAAASAGAAAAPVAP